MIGRSSQLLRIGPGSRQVVGITALLRAACTDWIKAHPEQDTGLWMLKNNKQRGTGLRLVPTAEAFSACFETTTRPGLEGMTLYR